MSHLFEFILNLPPWLVLTCVFLFPALEASIFVGVVVPGEIGVVLGGVCANQHKVSLVAVLVAAILGATIGDSVGFEVGKRWGTTLLRKVPDRILDEDGLDRAKASLRKHGGKAVFFGRFTAALRALIPGAAGMSGLPYRSFVLWNVIGGTLWATAFVLLGYLAGSQYERVEKYANWVGIALLLAVVAFVVVRYRRARHDADAT